MLLKLWLKSKKMKGYAECLRPQDMQNSKLPRFCKVECDDAETEEVGTSCNCYIDADLFLWKQERAAQWEVVGNQGCTYRDAFFKNKFLKWIGQIICMLNFDSHSKVLRQN